MLAVVAGYADTVGYLRFDAFAGLMSGNTVMLGISIAHGDALSALHRAAIIAAFLCGIAVSSVLRRRGVPLFAIVAGEMVLLIAAALVAPLAAAPLLALAMGLQNAAVTQFAGATLNTVFMTGNLQKFTQAVVNFHTPDDRAVITGVAVLWSSYLFGCAAGVIASKLLSMPLLLAACVLPAVLLRPKLH